MRPNAGRLMLVGLHAVRWRCVRMGIRCVGIALLATTLATAAGAQSRAAVQKTRITPVVLELGLGGRLVT